jgi:hypothetical protein
MTIGVLIVTAVALLLWPDPDLNGKTVKGATKKAAIVRPCKIQEAISFEVASLCLG